jgi:hypothetical protein
MKNTKDARSRRSLDGLVRHIQGLGCVCCARDASECRCEGVDWRSAREVDLERENAEMRKLLFRFSCNTACAKDAHDYLSNVNRQQSPPA